MPKDLQRLHDRASKLIEKIQRVSREAEKVSHQVQKLLAKPQVAPPKNTPQ